VVERLIFRARGASAAGNGGSGKVPAWTRPAGFAANWVVALLDETRRAGGELAVAAAMRSGWRVAVVL
jgi:hypothetical protein